MTGIADMFIVAPDRVSIHRKRISLGTKGFFVEGPRRVAECEVIALGSLAK
jgi:hypothetical protein